jgi:hypothetical protein
MRLKPTANYSCENSTANLYGLDDRKYEDFCRRRALYVCEPENKKPDFAEQVI